LSKKLGKQLSEGYDLADAEADGLTAEDMRQAIEEWQRAHEAYHSPPETEDITDLVQAQAFINDFLALSKIKQRDKLPSLLEDKALSFIEGVQHKDSNTYSKLKLSVGRNAFKEIEAALERRRQAKAAKKSEDNENKLRALHACFIFPHTPTDSNLGATGATASGSAGPAVAPEKNAGATGATASFPSEDERPCYRVYDEWFEEQDRKHKPGVYYHGIKDTKEGPQLFDLWVCGPLHVDADLCTHAGTDFGLMLRFMNRRGIWRQWGMPMELLKGSGEELRGELLAWGLNIDLPNRAYLSRYLSTRVTLRRLKSALTVGWHDKAFVLPDRVIGDEDVFFQSEHASQSEYSNRGTLSEWKEEIAARCVGNPLMVFAISAAFAGCLLELAHMDGGGFHYFGSSSEGKTTCVRAGCSV
jgi:hypothetical protein